MCESRVGQNGPGSPVSHGLYTLNKTTPESMCGSTTMILTRKLKNSESVIRKWETGIYPLVIHPVTYGLLKVSPDLCNYQKLTSERSKSNPNRPKHDFGHKMEIDHHKMG